MINILINFALLRVLLLPLVEHHVMGRPWAVALLVAACLPLIPILDRRLEYGPEGWLWAFVGLSHRLALTEGTQSAVWTRYAIAAVSTVAYIVREAYYFGFSSLQTVILAIFVAGLCVALIRFRREPLERQPPAFVAAPLRFCGQYSLEIYGISVLASHAITYAIAR